MRQFPGSRRYPQFDKETFAESLHRVGLEYVHFLELGGRRRPLPDSPNTAWRNAAFRGYADYMMSNAFRLGIDRLLAIAKKKRVAIMCAEAVWWRCHRGLIADYLKAHGISVLHIMGRGKTEPHPFTSAARLADGKLYYDEGQPRLIDN